MINLNREEIRALERSSILNFVTEHREYLTGRVLDFGCGKPDTCVQPMPYRHIIDANIGLYGRGEYVPFDKGQPEPTGKFDAVLMTQVIHLVEDPLYLLKEIMGKWHPTWLVMTYPTLWEEVQLDDNYRFTCWGMHRLLTKAGFKPELQKKRWSLQAKDFSLTGGYGVIAKG